MHAVCVARVANEIVCVCVGGESVLWSSGSEWRRHRAFVNSTILAPGKVARFGAPIVFEEVQRCVRGFDGALDRSENGDVEVMARVFQVSSEYAVRNACQKVLVCRLLSTRYRW